MRKLLVFLQKLAALMNGVKPVSFALTLLALILASVTLVMAQTAPQRTNMVKVNTAVGPMLAAKNVLVDGTVFDALDLVGVPAQCRSEALDILRQYLFLGYEDAIIFNPYLTIMCHIDIIEPNKSGFMGLAVGSKVQPGGLSYIKFENDFRVIEKFAVPSRDNFQKKSSLWSQFLHFATAVPPAGSLNCNRDGSCGESCFISTPVSHVRITSRYGKRPRPCSGCSDRHAGWDYGLPANQRGTCGTQDYPIIASADGVATGYFQGTPPKGSGYGSYIKIKHADGFETRYAHLKRSLIPVGSSMPVKKGQVIGYMGGAKGMPGSGSTSGCHLHYEIRKNGVALDPAQILGSDGKQCNNVSLSPGQLMALGNSSVAIDAALVGLSNYGGGALNLGDKPSAYCSTSVNGKCPNGQANKGSAEALEQYSKMLEDLKESPPVVDPKV